MNKIIFAGFERAKEAKAWILPNGRLMPTGGPDHAAWLKRNPKVTARYGIDLTGLDSKGHHQECRLRALRAGLVRVRYDINGGRLVIELHRQHFDPKRRQIKEPIRRAIIRLVKAVASKVDNFRIHVLDDDAIAIAAEQQPLFRLEDRDKLKHLPLVL